MHTLQGYVATLSMRSSKLGRDIQPPVPFASPPRQRRKTVAFILISLCVVVQLGSFLPTVTTGADWLWNLASGPVNIHDQSLALSPADQFKDDVWPIREIEPWDISTDFPYARNLAYDVEEGTWLRLDVHPSTGEIAFDMLGDIYCLPADVHSLQDPSLARPILRGVPHDSDPQFSPDGKWIVFRSDAELGVENIWIMDWNGCENMDISPDEGNYGRNPGLLHALDLKDADDTLLAAGVKETVERRQRRLVREGRLNAQRVTNETYRWVSDARFHPSGEKIVATKWYTSSRSLGAGEGWEYNIPAAKETVQSGSGKRLVGRNLPPGWSAEDYGEVQIGPEQFIWQGNDGLIFAKNIADTNGVYTYAKDVHQGIYAIFTHNLTTGVTGTLVDAFPGGASRPQLSRDGRTLAFVRRVRDKEALVLKDLQSGTLHHVWHGLSYDLTTISAPMGTYPSFAFTPHDDAVIIWAAGQIWRVPLSVNTYGEKVGHDAPSVIPFKAHIEKRIADTVRTERDLVNLETAGEQRLHAFKDLRVDEAGTRIVFQAAGVTYFQDVVDSGHSLATEVAQKVPVLYPDQPYYTPSFVPGTNDLVIHARWSDVNFTTFEISSISSGDVYEISEGLPLGRYHSPVLCGCSGLKRQLAFVKTEGTTLTGDVVATALPGLYIADIVLPLEMSSGTKYETKIIINNLKYVPSDINPNDRLTIRFLEKNTKLLVQQSQRAFTVDPAGADEVGNYKHAVVATGRMSQEITVSYTSGALASPEYVAFVDFFNVYVVQANAISDEPLWSKPGKAPKNIARTSLDGGHDVQWSQDGRKLFWLLGPYLHVLEIAKLSTCASDIKTDNTTFGISCIKKLLGVIELHVSYTTDVHRLREDAQATALVSGADTQNVDVISLTNATLLTMDTGSFFSDYIIDAVVVIRGGIITSVGSSRDVAVPPGSMVIDAQGGFVVPGFIDVHAHWDGFNDIFPARSWELETFLAYGVTCLHNPSSDNVDGFVERGLVENGFMLGPRIFHTGDVIYGAGAPGIHQDVPNLVEARSALVRIQVEGGPASFSYKNYNQYSRASRQRLLLAAQNMSMLSVPEGGMNQDWDITYIIDGMATVEHALPVPVLQDDVLNLFVKSGTGYTPTHIVNYGGAWGEQYVWSHYDSPNDPKLRRFTRHDILERVTETTSRPRNSYALFNTSTSAAKMVKKGLRVHIGAHGEPPLGLNYHAEMAFTRAGGLSNYEVLRAATIDAATSLGIHGSLGSLSQGKLADMIVYPPDVDILEGHMRSSLSIRYVMRGGRVWNAETMVEEWPLKGRRLSMPPTNAE